MYDHWGANLSVTAATLVATAGLVLVGWSASFTCLEMERRWRPGK